MNLIFIIVISSIIGSFIGWIVVDLDGRKIKDNYKEKNSIQ